MAGRAYSDRYDDFGEPVSLLPQHETDGSPSLERQRAIAQRMAEYEALDAEDAEIWAMREAIMKAREEEKRHE